MSHPMINAILEISMSRYLSALMNSTQTTALETNHTYIRSPKFARKGRGTFHGN